MMCYLKIKKSLPETGKQWNERSCAVGLEEWCNGMKGSGLTEVVQTSKEIKGLVQLDDRSSAGKQWDKRSGGYSQGWIYMFKDPGQWGFAGPPSSLMVFVALEVKHSLVYSLCL